MTEHNDTGADGGMDLSRRDFTKALGAASIAAAGAGATSTTAAAAPDVVQVGKGAYADGIPSHIPDDNKPSTPDYVTDNVSTPYPTNEWWSRLFSVEHSETLFSQPLFTEPTSTGLEVGYTEEWEVGDGGGVDLENDPTSQYVDMEDTVYKKFEPDFTVGHSATGQFSESLVDGWGDWHVTYQMGSTDPSMSVTQTRGSPFLFIEYAGGGAELTFSGSTNVFENRGNAVGVTVNGHHYGLFAPEGTSWSGTGGTTFSNGLGSAGYVSIVLLPDDTSSTFDTFAQYAHNVIRDTRMDWEYVNRDGGEIVSEVRTTFEFTVEDMTGSGGSGTITALYPHQHKYLAEGESLIDGFTYESARGTMKCSQGQSFTTALKYPGVLPNYPVMDSIADSDQLYQYAVGNSTVDTSLDMFNGDLAEKHGVPTLEEIDVVDWTRLQWLDGKEEPYGSTYWTGLNMNRWSETAALLNEMDMPNRRNLVIDVLRGTYEMWFNPKGSLDVDEDEWDLNMFFYDNNWGTLTGWSAGFNAYKELNDHHFHYGYFVKGASEIVRYDENFAKEENYGGMIKMLIKEFANPTRDDDMFPFLRNFSPYTGHSYASGLNPFHIGNNQEASSEAISAYNGLIRWGAFTDQQVNGHSIRDLGIFLYTHEIHAALEYWYDWEEENHPDEWERDYASVVWGDGYSHSTWWTERAEDTYAINVIPANGDKLYLGWDQDHAGQVYDELVDIKGDEDFEIWPGILTEYQGFSDPTAALERFQDWESGNYVVGEYYAPDMSNSKFHTFTMLKTLEELGSPTNDIVSNATFSHVFVTADGTKNYVAYNPSDTKKPIIFSDGTGFEVEPSSLQVQQGEKVWDSEPPEAPSDLSLDNATDTTVSLSWTESSSDDVMHYNVYDTSGGEETKVGELTGSSGTLDDVESATELELHLRAVDDAMNVSEGKTNSVSVTMPPNSEDYSQNAEAVDDSTLEVTFTPAHGAQAVDLAYGVDQQTKDQTVTMTDENGDGTWSATISGLVNNESTVNYHFTFEKAGRNWDTVEFSENFTFVPDTEPPTVPANLAVSNTSTTSASIGWDASEDDNSGVSHYNVFVNGLRKRKISSGKTAATLTNLSPETTYTVAVSAVDNRENESDRASTDVTTEKGSGGQLTGDGWVATMTEPSESELKVRFDHEQDASLAIIHYTPEGGAQQNVGMTAQDGSYTHTISGLSNGDTVDLSFTYQVGGIQSSSETKSYEFTGGGGGNPDADTTPPTVPSNVSSPAQDSTSVDLSWGASTDEDSSLDFYNVYVGYAKRKEVSPGSTSTTVSKLEADSTYEFTVTAVDTKGNESAGGSVEATTKPQDDTEKPSVPSTLQTTGQTDSSISLSWGASSDAGTGVDHYKVYVGTGDTAATTVDVGQTSATVTSLFSDTTYDLYVSAVDGAGNESARAGPVQATTTQGPDTSPPSVPSSLGTDLIAHTSVDLSWGGSTDQGTGVDHYNVYEGSTKVKEASGTSVTVSNLSPDTQYTFTVTAVDGAGNESTASNSVTVTTPETDDTTPPTAPSNLTVNEVASLTYQLSWDAAQDDDTGVEEYRIYENGTQIKTTSDTVAQIGFDQVMAAADYSYSVTAVDGAGNESAPSDTVSITLSDDPTLRVGFPNGSNVGPDGTVQATLSLSEVPEGLAGFDVVVNVSDTNVATIQNAAITDTLDSTYTSVSIAGDGSSVTLEAADTNDRIQAGDTDVELATITLATHDTGQTTVDMVIDQIDADGGSLIEPQVLSGQLTVEEDVGPDPIGDNAVPTDPDGDGLYEDVNGNGRLDSNDVVVLFQHRESASVTNQVEYFDFNQNGRSVLDFDDINELFEML